MSDEITEISLNIHKALFRYISLNQAVDTEQNVEQSFSIVLQSHHMSAHALMDLHVNKDQNSQREIKVVAIALWQNISMLL